MNAPDIPTAADVQATPPEGTTANSCPPDVPKKFWNDETGTLRTDALLKSYHALEKRLSQQSSEARGETTGIADQPPSARPARPEDYMINIDHGLFEPDPDINQQLFDAGFSQEQAQLVYDLAASELLPIAREISEIYRSEFDRERLESYFGGEDRWREASRQIRKWGRSHLPSDAFDALATSYEGILAMHKMMGGSNEPKAFGEGTAATSGLAETDLRQMMRSPRYWKDRDPSMITKVTEGFRRLYTS